MKGAWLCSVGEGLGKVPWAILALLPALVLGSCSGRSAPEEDASETASVAEGRAKAEQSPPELQDKADEGAPGETFFADPAMHTFRLQISGAGMRSLQRNPRTFVSASVRADGSVYTNVSIHLKGSVGSFRKLDDKPAFTLNFSKLAAGRKFHGLRKIHLNNSVQDRSYMNEYLAGELFRAAGVPATRVSYALVELNGRRLGLYVLKEGFSKDFLSGYFKQTKGNLYDNDPGREVTERLEKDSGDGPDDWSDLKRLADAAREPDRTKLWSRLEEVLDVDRFISFMAMEVITCHWDGYCLGKNNFRVYHDEETGRFLFFPHGTDQLFERTIPLQPNMSGLVARSVMRTAQGRRQYRERLGTLYTNVFKAELLTNQIRQLSQRIRPALAARSSGEARDFDGQVGTLRNRIFQRARYLEGQLSLPPPKPLEFVDNTAKLSGWFQQPGRGNVSLNRATIEDRAALRIQCHGAGVGSWRTSVALPGGKYRFSGLARARNVVAESAQRGSGGGLRISKGQRGNQLTGSADWTRLAHEFTVEAGGTDVVLVCELIAREGEIWFDAESLVLERIQ